MYCTDSVISSKYTSNLTRERHDCIKNPICYQICDDKYVLEKMGESYKKSLAKIAVISKTLRCSCEKRFKFVWVDDFVLCCVTHLLLLQIAK